MSTQSTEQICQDGDLEQVRVHVAHIHRPIGDEGPALENIADRLQGILEATEQSCEQILHSLESVLELSKNIRAQSGNEATIAPACDALEEHAISALESCAFQDLTSQRVSKIVRDLLHLECSVDAMTETLGREGVEALAEKLAIKEAEEGGDVYLMGPQNEKDAIGQKDVDAVFG
ncbi:MAG: hypothetical protein AAGF58_09455 [Pseudomonadota bacterium]